MAASTGDRCGLPHRVPRDCRPLATASRFDAPFATPLHRVLHEVTMVPRWEGLVLALVVGVAVESARGGVLRRALPLVFAVSMGIGVNLGGFAVTGALPGPLFGVARAAAVSDVPALLVGGGGYALGQGAAVLRERLATGRAQ